MDHLWLDSDVQEGFDEVEILDLCKYSGDFKTFLPSQGYVSEDTLRQIIFEPFARDHSVTPDNLEKSRWNQALSTFQEWLIFGQIIEFGRILGAKIPRDDFVFDVNSTIAASGKVAGTGCLEELTQILIEKHASEVLRLDNPAIGYYLPMMDVNSIALENDETLEEAFERFVDGLSYVQMAKLASEMEPLPFVKERRDNAIKMLQRATRFLEACMKGIDYEKAPEICKVTWLAASVMSETVMALTDLILGGGIAEIDQRNYPSTAGYFWAKGSRICPSRLHSASVITISEAYIATMVRRSENKGHYTCTLEHCKERPHGDIQDLPKHHESCPGNCDMFNVDQRMSLEIRRLLESGQYPVLKYENRARDSCMLKVKQGHSSTEYVAFSHVWSHGLGNPMENALPTCQMLFLKGLLLADNSSIDAFWIDTLCIPVEEPHRRLAIKEMRATYQHAAKVIVVDRDVLKTGRGRDFLRSQSLLLSDWMTRLWTLQEALLADRKLHVAFADGVMQLRNVLRRRNTSEKLEDFLVWEQLFPRLIQDLSLGRSQTGPDDADFLPARSISDALLLITSSMHRRTTTKSPDEAICLATLMDMNLDTFSYQPSLEDVLSRVDSLPQDILFAPGPRSQQQSFGWCAQSFLNSIYVRYKMGSRIARLGNLGILVEQQVTLMDNDAGSRRNVIQTEQAPHHVFIVRSEDGADLLSFRISTDDSFNAQRLAYFADGPLAIVHQPPYLGLSSTEGVLVGSIDMAEGVLTSKYISRIHTSTGTVVDLDHAADSRVIYLTGKGTTEKSIWVN